MKLIVALTSSLPGERIKGRHGFDVAGGFGPLSLSSRHRISNVAAIAGGTGETQTQQTDSGGGGRHDPLDCRLFFLEQAEPLTVGIVSRETSRPGATQEAQAAVAAG